ncbi:MAG TPA: ATP-binding cassette domain-containing protein, partial [Bryobacteraceae bacterium]|nr:ATP-binding cassette domain-containing protein [Bryobacteraceae bacterium]
MNSHPVSPLIEDILQVENLRKTIDNGSNRVEILRGLTFSIPRGEFVAIMGASGSGKSTLLGLMAGLDTATSGRVLLDGLDITNLAEDKLARVRGTKIGFVFQAYQLVPTLTAEENVLLPAELIGSGGDLERRARELLGRVGLGNRGH